MKRFVSVLALLFAVSIMSSGFMSCTSQPAAPAPTPTPVCGISFGYHTDNDDNGWNYNYIVGAKFTMAKSGYINAIGLKLGGGQNVRVGVYSNGVNQPANLITQSAVVAGNLGWNEIPIPQTSLTSGTVYWLLAATDGSSIEASSPLSFGYGYANSSWSAVNSGGMPATIAVTWYVSSGELKIYGAGCF